MIRQETSNPIVVVDAGAMLFPHPFITPSQIDAKKVQAEGLLEAMARLGYDGIGIGPQDLAAGAGFLLNQPTEKKLPWLSLNLVDQNNEQPLFTPYVIKQVEDLTVGILSISHQLENITKRQTDLDYRIADWEKPLKHTLQTLEGQTDLNILLSSMPEAVNKKIAETYDRIHLIIQAGLQAPNKSPLLHNNALITQVGIKGKYIGRLDIQWLPSGRWEGSIAASQKEIKDRLDRINWQLGRLKNRNPADELNDNAQYKELMKEKDQLEIQSQEAKTVKLASAAKYSSYTNKFIGLPVSLPEDQEISDIVFKTKIAVNNVNKGVLSKPVQEKNIESKNAFATLAGWQACQQCHPTQTKFWQTTRHYRAWETLVKAGQHFNPECLICHVTLPTYDQETVTAQNLLVNLAQEYKSISCETCHGPAKKHAQQPSQSKPKKPGEETCLTCHTPERDTNFIYSEKLQLIRCPTAGH